MGDILVLKKSVAEESVNNCFKPKYEIGCCYQQIEGILLIDIPFKDLKYSKRANPTST